MRRLAVGNPFITATQLQSILQSDYSVTLGTTQIKTRLKKWNLSAHTPARKPLLTKRMRNGLQSCLAMHHPLSNLMIVILHFVAL